MPGLVEADDDGLYVLKFRGAGQGPKALAAEMVAGELARALGLPVPELVLVELDPALGAAEPDPEIQELIARQRRDQPRHGLPSRRVAVHAAAPAGARAGRRRRVVRRVRAQRGPHAAQPEPAALAPRAVADRPRRGAVRAPRAAAIRVAPRGRSASRRSATTCCCRSPARSRRPTRAWRRGWTRDARGDRRRGPRRVGGRRRLRRAPAPPGSTTARASWRRPTVPGSPFQYAMLRVVPRVERGEAINAGVALFCRPLRYLGARAAARRGAARRARARLRPGRGARAAGHAGRGRRGPARGRRTSPRCRSRSASTGSPRRRARSCSRRPSTPASPSDPAAELEKLFAALVSRRAAARLTGKSKNVSGNGSVAQREVPPLGLRAP